MKQPILKSPASSEGYKLFFLGFATLYLELIFIRYLAGNIWNLGYFPNLVLLTVFMGMGIGFIFHHFLSERISPVLFHLSYFLILILVVYVYYKHPAVPGLTAWGSESGGELFFTDGFRAGSDTKYAPFVFCFLSLLFIFSFISQRTAKLFRQFKPLTAYTLDIAGSCTGIVTFMLISWFQIPAYLWFVLFTVIFMK